MYIVKNLLLSFCHPGETSFSLNPFLTASRHIRVGIARRFLLMNLFVVCVLNYEQIF